MNALQTVNSVISHPKIRSTHLDRLAYIYVRQSTPGQVVRNQESQMLQRQLAQHAEALGWRADRVRIIDTDLGISAKTSAGRDGYQEMVAEVSLWRVGIIFSWQVNRVSRNNNDWTQLMALASRVDTLIADIDGVYDLLRDPNDRLVLGVKAIMSEAELYWMRQRLDAGRMNQVKRGAYRQAVPTGLVRLEDGRVVKDPDDQVRDAIELVLHKFEEFGNGGKVLRYLRAENILLPRRQYSGLHVGKLLWKIPTDGAIYRIVTNPAYAGAFVYGQTQVDYARQTPGNPRSGRVKRPMADWQHVQQDIYPAYISWEQFVTNQEQLHRNHMRFEPSAKSAQGAPREGAALLQGLMRCGYCGCAMYVGYKYAPSYRCQARFKRTGEGDCLSVGGQAVEKVVLQAFFDALRPAHIDALEAVLAQQEADHQKLVQQWQERLKRSAYEVQVARRAYDAVDAENRLVAAELERRWETALRAHQDTQEAFNRFQRLPRLVTLSPELCTQLKRLSEMLPQLWPSLPHDQQKALLRSLIAQVICRRDTPGLLEVRIVWVSGHYSVFYVQHPLFQDRDLANYAQLTERIKTLWEQGVSDVQIAQQLTVEGFHSARRPRVSADMVLKVRHEHGWYSELSHFLEAIEAEGYLTMRGLAAQLGADRDWVYDRVYNHTIPPHLVKCHPQSKVLLIRKDPDLVDQLRALLTAT